MSWLQRFRKSKRIVPEKTSIDYDWGTREMSYSGPVHPFVSVKTDVIESQIEYVENLFNMYVRFMRGLKEIYGEDFESLVRKKCRAEVVKLGKFSEEDSKELDRMISDMAQRAEAEEDRHDRRRIMQYCMNLED